METEGQEPIEIVVPESIIFAAAAIICATRRCWRISGDHDKLHKDVPGRT